MFQKLYKAVIKDTCCLCDISGFKGLDLCHACHIHLPHNHSCCFQCAAPFATTARKSNHLICGRCVATTAGIDHSIVPFLYRPPIDYMIKGLKFSEQMKYSRLLGELLGDAVEDFYTGDPEHSAQFTFPDAILPVPTHKERRLQRGFNQAEEIAAIVAKRFGYRCDPTLVARSASRQSQTSLSAAQREANIRRTFEIPNPEAIKQLHVAVVDDVYTTGATARAIARKLKSAGAARVSIWAVARTP